MTEPVDGAALPGRAAEERSLLAALHDSVGGPRMVALVGDAGIGKTVLLRRGITMARSAGFLVVGGQAAATSAEEVLLTSLLAATDRLPEGLRRPLAQRLAGGPQAPGPVPLRMAVLAVVKFLCRGGPVLVVLDDVAAEDDETMSLLRFVARRMSGERLVVLLASRTVAGFGRPHEGIRLLPVPALSATAAAGLLDGLPQAPTGRMRADILRLARGNPEVITRLVRVADPAADPFGGEVAGDLGALPTVTRRLLLVAATTEEEDLGILLSAAGAGLPDCRPAEEAGLISVVAGRLRFVHPMDRIRCLFTAAPSARHDAHAALVGVLPADAPLRDWHAAHLVEPTDDDGAAVFERAAESAARHGRGLDAAAMLERAAQWSTDEQDAARLYGRAAAEADRSGDIAWALDLWDRMRAHDDDPARHAATAMALGNTAMFRPGRTVLGRLNRLLAAPLADPEHVSGLLSLAARSVLSDGHPADVSALGRLINRFGPDRRGTQPPSFPIALADAVADPAGWTGRHGALQNSPLMEPVEHGAERARLMSVAGIAWVTDDTEIAVDHYRRALEWARTDQSYGVSALATVLFTEVLLECGFLDEAATALRDATDFVGGNRFAVVRRALAAQQATVLIRRGELDEARTLLDRDAAAGPAGSRLVRYLRLRAAGQLAAAAGDIDQACTTYLQMFAPDGSPLHYLMAQRSVVELAAAAVVAGRRPEVAGVLRLARARAARPTDRREWSWQVASALLHPHDEAAGRRMTALLARLDAADRWPHEYATAQTAYAHRLSAQRRYSQARPLLVAALDILVRAGASHEAAVVREKSRAVGVRAPVTGEAPFTALTPQQQRIARLAADGLSNRDIATQVKIAPRTVSFHLYQIFPKLGITRRAQLRGAVVAA
ncbi:LuxR family transcriptional regulator [Actinoplanes sp. M2I2]|uniref:helix-turn-helix transcriptional regulator n=1 Tax=Actinoplanes sp. M2I2 TaxID=1734444 RepID=UPI0020207CA8|nr:LuxR family transcriptional regulator [Actinoplanes sp. M2I2]